MLKHCITPLFVSLFLLVDRAYAAPIGVDNISSGSATRVEGGLRRTAYAGAAELHFDGSWQAVFGDKGVHISCTIDSKVSEVSFIGEDQFELVTLEKGVQRAAIRSLTNQIVANQNIMIAQFIAKRIEETQKSFALSNGAAAWFHLAFSLKADTQSGVRLVRNMTATSLNENWYVSNYLKSRTEGDYTQGTIPVPSYTSNGFLAISFQSKPGEITAGEIVEIKEFWPKQNPTSGDDVDLFRLTVLSVSNVVHVSNANLLPVVTYADARVEDFRFQKTLKDVPLNLPIMQSLWVVKESKNWSTLAQVNSVKQGFATADAVAGPSKHVRGPVIGFMIILTIVFCLFLFRQMSVKRNNE